jgi:hypothetical protein
LKEQWDIVALDEILHTECCSANITVEEKVRGGIKEERRVQYCQTVFPGGTWPMMLECIEFLG